MWGIYSLGEASYSWVAFAPKMLSLFAVISKDGGRELDLVLSWIPTLSSWSASQDPLKQIKAENFPDPKLLLWFHIPVLQLSRPVCLGEDCLHWKWLGVTNTIVPFSWSFMSHDKLWPVITSAFYHIFSLYRDVESIASFHTIGEFHARVKFVFPKRCCKHL